MRLLSLQLHTEFRGLSPGFKILFRKDVSDTGKIEPLCFVGLNGSGKSNLLQVLGEIFYYLETYLTDTTAPERNYRAGFGFTITYQLDNLSWNIALAQFNNRIEKIWHETEEPVVQIVKQERELPEFRIRMATSHPPTYRYPEEIEEGFHPLFELEKDDLLMLLPKRVVAYSSGMNELISNPFIKININYFDAFQKRTGESAEGALDVNRLFFMDYESNKMVLLANYLFQDDNSIYEKKISLLNKVTGIKQLEKFSITIRFQDTYYKPVELPSELNIQLENLKNCATAWNDEGEGHKRILRLDYKIDTAAYKAFRHYFKTPYNLYRTFYLLGILNVHTYGKELRNRMKNAGVGVNLSNMVPKFNQERLLFFIDDVCFSKTGSDKHVYYRHLSDGEHQLLHVLGTVILMDIPGTLFILDEPETHFNPEWRSKLVSLLNKIISFEPEQRQQEFILTSHSPFIVSDCKPEHVFIFEKTGKKNEVKYSQPDFNTFGASVNQITMKVFGKSETIAGLANERLRQLKEAYDKKKKTKRQIMDELATLGDSIEKLILIDEINSKKKPKP